MTMDTDCSWAFLVLAFLILGSAEGQLEHVGSIKVSVSLDQNVQHITTPSSGYLICPAAEGLMYDLANVDVVLHHAGQNPVFYSFQEGVHYYQTPTLNLAKDDRIEFRYHGKRKVTRVGGITLFPINTLIKVGLLASTLYYQPLNFKVFELNLEEPACIVKLSVESWTGAARATFVSLVELNTDYRSQASGAGLSIQQNQLLGQGLELNAYGSKTFWIGIRSPSDLLPSQITVTLQIFKYQRRGRLDSCGCAVVSHFLNEVQEIFVQSHGVCQPLSCPGSFAPTENGEGGSCFCEAGQFWNKYTQHCEFECPELKAGNAGPCPCPGSKYWDSAASYCAFNCTQIPFSNETGLREYCSCLSGYNWDFRVGGCCSIAEECQCQSRKIWNAAKHSCEIFSTAIESHQCSQDPLSTGKTSPAHQGQCECKQHSKWRSMGCVCQSGYKKSGSKCVETLTGLSAGGEAVLFGVVGSSLSIVSIFAFFDLRKKLRQEKEKKKKEKNNQNNVAAEKTEDRQVNMMQAQEENDFVE